MRLIFLPKKASFALLAVALQAAASMAPTSREPHPACLLKDVLAVSLRGPEYEYDAVGNVAAHTNFNGQTIAYAYDALNRLASKTLPGDNTVSYTV